LIIKTFKNDLIDPLDNPPSLIKTSMRVCGIVYKSLKDSSAQVHTACCDALLNVYEYCLTYERIEILETILYTHLEEILIIEANKDLQIGAAKCLYCLFVRFKEEMLDYFCPKFVSLFIVIFH
jgi:hypothetical protein